MNESSYKKKIEDLKRQLAEERKSSKKTIVNLQKELQRCNADPSQQKTKLSLIKEVSKERTMRLDTERRLGDLQTESNTTWSRMKALQEECRKMSELVSKVLQYKSKIEQLKQESASMKTTYENNLQKYCKHLSNLERDNVMLRNQIKKMESQLLGKGDETNKSKLLLERLKMVEAENSALVLENEQQRQQYERCLDEVAGQVVQALLAQKTLREECIKLQSRVIDLEQQNKHLNILFQQRIRFTSDSILQMQPSHMDRNGDTNYGEGISHLDFSKSDMTVHFLDNADSLQSMYSEIMSEDSPGKPQLSSPPPWLKEKTAYVEQEFSVGSSNSFSANTPLLSSSILEQPLQMMIETEFPATNTSPKIKRVAVNNRRTRSLERGISDFMGNATKSEQKKTMSNAQSNCLTGPRLKQSVSSDAIGQLESIDSNQNHSQKDLPNILHAVDLNSTWNGSDHNVVLNDASHSKFREFNKDFGKFISDQSDSEPLDYKLMDKEKVKSSNSPQKASGKIKITSEPVSQYYYYDYSDDDSDSRPVSRDFSHASTMSLNEILDSSMEGEVEIDDDFFSDWSSIQISPTTRIDHLSGQAISYRALETNDQCSISDISKDPNSFPFLQKAYYEQIEKLRLENKEKSIQTTKSKEVNISSSMENPEFEDVSVPNITEVFTNMHEDIFQHSYPPSPNLSQWSQDLGYASKSSCCHSSTSPSPSIPHKQIVKQTKEFAESKVKEIDIFTNSNSRSISPAYSRRHLYEEDNTNTVSNHVSNNVEDNTKSVSNHNVSNHADRCMEKDACKGMHKKDQMKVLNNNTSVSDLNSAIRNNQIEKPLSTSTPNNQRSDSTRYPKPGTTDAFIGYVFNDDFSCIPIHNDINDTLFSFKNHKHSFAKGLYNSSSLCKDISMYSSCEYINNERSPGKDDGYSTMSSDVHPDMIEKKLDVSSQISDADYYSPFSESLLTSLINDKLQSTRGALKNIKTSTENNIEKSTLQKPHKSSTQYKLNLTNTVKPNKMSTKFSRKSMCQFKTIQNSRTSYSKLKLSKLQPQLKTKTFSHNHKGIEMHASKSLFVNEENRVRGNSTKTFSSEIKENSSLSKPLQKLNTEVKKGETINQIKDRFELISADRIEQNKKDTVTQIRKRSPNDPLPDRPLVIICNETYSEFSSDSDFSQDDYYSTRDQCKNFESNQRPSPIPALKETEIRSDTKSEFFYPGTESSNTGCLALSGLHHRNNKTFRLRKCLSDQSLGVKRKAMEEKNRFTSFQSTTSMNNISASYDWRNPLKSPKLMYLPESHCLQILDNINGSGKNLINNETSHEQRSKLFNSQFYSLCKVDSTKSLLSRDGHSFTNLTDSIIPSLFEIDICRSNNKDPERRIEANITTKQFGQISQQLDKLSENYDPLNCNMPNVQENMNHDILTNIFPSKSLERDEYYWVDDEIFENSFQVTEEEFSNKDQIDLLKYPSLNDKYDTWPLDADADNNFYKSDKLNWQTNRKNNRNSLRSSVIKRSLPSLKPDQKQNSFEFKGPSDDFWRCLKNLSNNSINCGIYLQSENGSDNSLASNIGLDHVMCQRLIGDDETSSMKPVWTQTNKESHPSKKLCTKIVECDVNSYPLNKISNAHETKKIEINSDLIGFPIRLENACIKKTTDANMSPSSSTNKNRNGTKFCGGKLTRNKSNRQKCYYQDEGSDKTLKLSKDQSVKRQLNAPKTKRIIPTSKSHDLHYKQSNYLHTQQLHQPEADVVDSSVEFQKTSRQLFFQQYLIN